MAFTIERAQQVIEQEITNLALEGNPDSLYEPIRYMMGLGGKRMRPALALCAVQMFRTDWEQVATAALSVEVFHNFTLMHDDIMDNAPIRRGKPTVHEVWDNNVGILSGDVMLVKAYELLLTAPPEQLPVLIRKFNRCACEVCEGQQFDMEFESQEKVGILEYLEMIRLKTAVLLGYSLELGARLGGASDQDANLLYQVGVNMGIAFQLQDDFLDVFADSQKFGKQVGGDIIANKKTYLLLKALELAKGETSQQLNHWLARKTFDPTEKVGAITAIYKQLGIGEMVQTLIAEYVGKAEDSLEHLAVAPVKKQPLLQLIGKLAKRDH